MLQICEVDGYSSAAADRWQLDECRQQKMHQIKIYFWKRKMMVAQYLQLAILSVCRCQNRHTRYAFYVSSTTLKSRKEHSFSSWFESLGKSTNKKWNSTSLSYCVEWKNFSGLSHLNCPFQKFKCFQEFYFVPQKGLGTKTHYFIVRLMWSYWQWSFRVKYFEGNLPMAASICI